MILPVFSPLPICGAFPLFRFPPVFLAQVDSSVGGKTGVDIPEGKNLVGAFYQPKAVYIDMAVLATLPVQEFLGGLAEVIKYGVIRDAVFFSFLETRELPSGHWSRRVFEEMIATCCRIKAEVVACDEREGGLRKDPQLWPYHRPCRGGRLLLSDYPRLCRRHRHGCGRQAGLS